MATPPAHSDPDRVLDVAARIRMLTFYERRRLIRLLEDDNGIGGGGVREPRLPIMPFNEGAVALEEPT